MDERTMKLVSIIIPTCDRPLLVVRAIQSVLRQSYSDHEVIVVDDASAGDTQQQVAACAGDRVRFIRLEARSGANVARNRGISEAKGDFIAFLDDDDAWEPDKLAEQVRVLSETGPALCYTGKKVINARGNRIGYSYHTPKFPDHYRSILYDNFIGSTSSVMAPARAFTEIGLFDERLSAFQDYDLYIRLLKKYRVVGINTPLVRYLEDRRMNKTTLNAEKCVVSARYLLAKYRAENRYRLLRRALMIIFIRRSLRAPRFGIDVMRTLLLPKTA
jgi:glycosyltransferase involved in cell wall biosynthesis